MTIKNIKQTFRFPAFALLGDSLPKELTSLIPAGDQDAIMAQVTPDIAEKLGAFGVKSPTDLVLVETTLGIFLFDCYILGAVTPNTPMGKHISAKYAQELAQLLERDEFTIPDYALEAIRKTLSVENLWNRIQATAYITDKEDTKRFLTLSSQGISYYHNILSAAAESVYDQTLHGVG